MHAVRSAVRAATTKPSAVPVRIVWALLAWGWCAASSLAATATADTPLPAAAELATLVAWRARYATEVDHRLEVPAADRAHYLGLLTQSLVAARLDDRAAQAVVLVDRSPLVQAAFVVVRTAAGGWAWIGASAVSTGKVGTFEHFVTPLGVFPHTPANPDFRAEGTYNQNHIRGYGLRGRRVFDFGWQQAERGWGGGGISTMRLQMHATDPNLLESRLGQVASEGCIRIPATLNVFLDIYGVLDAEYEGIQPSGRAPWVLRPDRRPVPWTGRYLVIVDSQSQSRPAWSRVPSASRNTTASTRAAASAPAG